MQMDSSAYFHTQKNKMKYSLPALQENFFNLMNLGLVSHFGGML